jgi:hypothetical protein
MLLKKCSVGTDLLFNKIPTVTTEPLTANRAMNKHNKYRSV